MSRPLRLLNECRDIMVRHLSAAFPTLMDRVDDSLFELADKSENNTKQAYYFEVMRQLRLERDVMGQLFEETLTQTVSDQSNRSSSATASTSFGEDSFGELGLVDADEMEESLAITNLVGKIRSNCKSQLFALDKRVSHLVNDPAAEEFSNPVGPASMCKAIRVACHELDVDIEIKLLILKLYDKYVAADLESVFAQMNDHLVTHDVLPEIKTEIRRTPTASRNTAAGTTEVAVPNLPANGSESAGLAALSYAIPTSANPGFAPVPNAPALLSAVQQVMNVNGFQGDATQPVSPHILGNLTCLQSGQRAFDPALDGELPSAQITAGTTNVLHELRQSTITENMGNVDTMMIDVVAMMFDYILDDDAIPAPMKALIGRLQIPFLKVALLDKTFFARKFHPARKLLNRFAEAAVGWSEEDENAEHVHAQLETLVQLVLNDFEDDISIFSEVDEALRTFLENEEATAQDNAAPSADALEARARLADAARRAAQEVKKVVDTTDYQFLDKFLTAHWAKLLATIYVQGGDSSAQWSAAVQTMTDLAWSIAPKADHQERLKLITLLPSLLKAVKAGMEQIGVAQEQRQRFISALSKIHLSLMKASPPNGQPDVAVPETEAETEVDPVSEQVDSFVRTEEIEHEVTLRLNASIEAANKAIFEKASVEPQCTGMGTTVVSAIFHQGLMSFAHVGDSRLYRLRDGDLDQLTTDHSLQREMIDKGLYTEERAKREIGSNIVTRALGAEPTVMASFETANTQIDDLFLLCSDGLSDLVEEGQIRKILKTQRSDLEQAAAQLVEAANDSGGRDNISVILVNIDTHNSPSAIGESIPADTLSVAALTDVGRRRAHNEDQVGTDLGHGLVVLADGMGGCNAGEVASEMAVQLILEHVVKEPCAPATAEPNVAPGGINFAAINAMFDDIAAEEASPSNPLDSNQTDAATQPANAAQTKHAPDEPPTPHDEADLTVQEMEVGQWIQLHNPASKPQRARLAWISASSGTYLFTDRQGHKVLEASAAGLAVELRSGNATPLDDAPLFDRAVSSLVSRLRPGASMG